MKQKSINTKQQHLIQKSAVQITVTAGTFNFQSLSLRLSSLPIKKTVIYIFNIDGFIFNL